MLNKHKKNRTASVLGLGLAASMMMMPMNVYASEFQLNDVLQQAGIASVLDVRMTEEEYINKANKEKEEVSNIKNVMW